MRPFFVPSLSLEEGIFELNGKAESWMSSKIDLIDGKRVLLEKGPNERWTAV